MLSNPLPTGLDVLLLGLAVSVGGSFADNLLGSGMIVEALQVALWTLGGVLVMAGLASRTALRAGQRGSAERRPRRTRAYSATTR